MAKKHIVRLVVMQVALLCGVLLFAIAPPVHADPPQVKSLQSYCNNNVPNKAKGGCTAANMGKLTDAVSGNCTGKDAQACVEKAAEGLVDKIAAKNPKSTKDFNDALDTVLNNIKPGVGGGDAVDKGAGTQGEHCSDGSGNCDLVKLYVDPFIRVLTITVGLAITASIIMGAIQYITSSGDPQKTAAAKSRISNAFLAFFIYAFLYAFLNFLVPGGIF